MAGAGLPNGVSLPFRAPLKGLPLASVVFVMLLFVFLLVSFFRLPKRDRVVLEFSEGADIFGGCSLLEEGV